MPTGYRLLEKLPKHKMVMDPKSYRMAHPVYSMQDIEKIEVTHRIPENFRDRIALSFIRLMRGSFDKITGYNEKSMTTQQWLNRVVFLEAVAGVPGMVGGMTRHLKSLRTHLFIFLELKQPKTLFKLMIALT